MFGDFVNKKISKGAEKLPKWCQIAMSAHTAHNSPSLLLAPEVSTGGETFTFFLMLLPTTGHPLIPSKITLRSDIENVVEVLIFFLKRSKKFIFSNEKVL